MNPSPSYAQHQRNPRRHLISFGLVLALHALLLWALLSGLARQVVQVTQQSVQAMLLADDKPAVSAPKSATPPPPKPTLPEPVANTTPTPNSISTPTAAAPATVGTPSTAPVQVGASMAPGNNCPKPAYPPASRRLEEEGTVSLRFLIGADGSVLQSEIAKSSGFVRLDEAARNALSHCQFRAGSVNGKPEQSWASIQYTWRLE